MLLAATEMVRLNLLSEDEKARAFEKAGSIIRDATWLVAITAGAWVIVTIINKFF